MSGHLEDQGDDPQPTEVERARIALAAEMRRSMHLLMSRDPDQAVLSEVTARLRGLSEQIEKAPKRERGNVAWKGPSELVVPADGQVFPDSLDRPISGKGNPFSIPMTVFRDGDAVTTTVTLQAGFEGAPGRSHGGFVSAIFDDLFGSLPMLHNKIAFTASLTVKYVAASPVFEPVTFRAWIDNIDGKKISMVGQAHHGDTLVTTASALFIDASEYIRNAYGPSE